MSDTLPPSEENIKLDRSMSEHDVIMIQSAIRAYLAGRNLKKRKSLVKFQAAVRGHVTRKLAVSTLRCVLAIIKMQALVRARYKHHNAESLVSRGGNAEAKEDESLDYMVSRSHGAGQRNNSPTEVLLRNGFARLILMSKPKKTKPIYISCDPLKSDSAWQWLGRWMAAGSRYPEQDEENASYLREEIYNPEEEVKSSIDGNVSLENTPKTLSKGSTRSVVKEEFQDVADGFNQQFNYWIKTSSITENSDANQKLQSDHVKLSCDCESRRSSDPEFAAAKVETEDHPPVSCDLSESSIPHVSTTKSVEISFTSSHDCLQCKSPHKYEGNELADEVAERRNASIIGYTDGAGYNVATNKSEEQNSGSHDSGISFVIVGQRKELPCETTDSFSTIEHQAYGSSLPETSLRS